MDQNGYADSVSEGLEPPERRMLNLLRSYLDPGKADECFEALEGLDHDDLVGIEQELSRRISDRRALEKIMSEYQSWMIQRKLRG